MPRFFLSADRLSENPVVIDGEDARHISLSLRMAVGDPLILSDGQGKEYHCVIVSMDKKTVCARVEQVLPCESEPPCKITLYQCLAKGEKMDTIIQKAVEYGVTAIVPVESERCVAKLPSDSADRKLMRWQKISDEAAGQCGRGILPTVGRPMSYDDAVRAAASSRLAFLCYEGEGTVPLPHLLSGDCPETLSFLVGPEGGISKDEVQKAVSAGLHLCGLGKRILRTESASGFVLAAISARWEMTQ
ncbi:MAG: 16S rRNA (uracil(1498)-N(3))-methyltransferase [Eubacteriales bacterium]